MSLITVSNMSVSLGRRQVLHGIDLSLEPGEIVTIVGPNGSGKTTLLRGIIGAVPLSKGTIKKAPKLRLGYVPQKLALDRSFPMTANGLLTLGRPQQTLDDNATLAMAACGVEDLGKRAFNDLSGGQMQRVLLARALMNRPQVLLLDEPTTGLDQTGAAAFYELVETARRQYNCAVLMVSHDLHVVMSASDRVICLNGHICCQGKPATVLDAPEYRALFGTGTKGTLALYQHEHDHDHHEHSHGHDHGPSK